MINIHSADPGPSEAISVVEIPTTGDNAVMSARDAARTLASYRHKRTETPTETQPATPERPQPAAPQATTESADEAVAAPLETEATGETQATDPASEPPLELPRSWTKDRAEPWAKLDRGTQEFLLDHDRKASAEVRRSQNEAADARKAVEADRAKVEQARTQYETALPALLDTIQQQQNLEFADVKTIDDVQRLAREDWPRYVMWDAQQKRIAAVNQQVEASKQRQTQERQQKLGQFAQRESELFAEKAPEFADPAKKTKLQESAVSVLRDLGFQDQELGEMWRGEKELSLHDHRLQLLLLDGVRYREAKAVTAKATAKPVPPVQRPGVSQPRGAAAAADVQNLSKRLDQTGSAKDAARLLMGRRAAAAR
jgi:hypothetical protein